MNPDNKSATQVDNVISPSVTEDRISALESRIDDLEEQIEEVKDIALSYAVDEAKLGNDAYEIAWEERIKLSLLILRVDEIEEAIE